MRVQKRDGHFEMVDLNKITVRIKKLIDEIPSVNKEAIDPILISQKVCASLHDGVTTSALDTLASEIAISMGTLVPEYASLAAYIVVSDLQKEVSKCVQSFSASIYELHAHGFVSDEIQSIVKMNESQLNNAIVTQRDYLFDYFAIKTLQKGYLQKIVDDKIVETPQYMFLRVSLGIHKNDIEAAIETYNLMSNKYFIHATPTLYNSGSVRPQMASCFLVAMQDDSIKGIYNTLSDCAQISKWAGGIGLHIHNVRGKGSSIRGAKGVCTGIVPMLKVFNDTARYVNQEGKRPGSIAVYLQVDHPDIFNFLDLKKNTGDEEERARDLFYAVWIPDLFMEKVKNKEMWCLFDPHTCPGLADAYGEEYSTLYKKYEDENKYNSKVNAQDLWVAICTSQIETGTPYILYKDACNSKSNQQNLGTIKSSNLCCEIVEYTSKEEIAVCNLASICLPQFVKTDSLNAFDHKQLYYVTQVITRNLNKVIDNSFYPVSQAEVSNKRHRPIGIGVQGLADVYQLMGIDFDSEEAAQMNEDIFETIYYAAMSTSMELAKYHGSYETFEGSPLSKGVFQFDLWNKKPSGKMNYNWNFLKSEVIKHGARNSLLLAPMPTATTSQIMGNNEAIEPYTSNLYLRRTVAGEFIVINKHLVKDLQKHNLWNQKMKDMIIYNEGSIQSIESIPKYLKKLYKTAWELSQKTLIDQAATRGKYICQSQSLNLFVPRPNVKILSSMHFYSWSQGLKTGIYYLRTKPAANAIQFTIDPTACESCSA
jgi:ribonucleoside-diphosphate reductase alpha chain